MSWTFAITAFLMGLAGGPHCIAMCGAPSAAVIRIHPVGGAASLSCISPQRGVVFHLGRLLGYGLLGALAGSTVQGVGWLATQTQALRPAWTLLHMGVLAWGLMLLVLARQPAWTQVAGQSLWRRLQPITARAHGVGLVGVLWALLPCGLLYSAVLVASLAGGPVRGAFSMVLFGLGSAVSLVAGPAVWQWFRARSGRTWGAEAGTRAAGAVLAAAAMWALWMDFSGQLADWCAT